jgi:putative hydrolase of HD superfamily
MPERLDRQLAFLIEIDKMKTILRQTLLMDKSRQENDAEHSWHFAMMAMVLFEYAENNGINLNRVIRIALVHDLVEVYAGDTFAYDTAGSKSKEMREKEAADKLFALPPPEQGREIRALWDEFEAMETPESLYANAIDRFQPLLHNYMTDGHTWQIGGGVSIAQVYKRMEPIRHGAPGLWPTVEKIINESIERGYLRQET